MKGVPIKFRGKAENGEYVYGDLMQGNYDESAFHIKPRKKCPVYVDKNSVAQLVGYDADGNEVYEDDRLILGSHEYIAGIRPVSYTDDKKYYMPEEDFSYFLLKENKKMTEKILPLPVTKNKFGQRVAAIDVEKYYRQIFEEVLEAHKCKNICDYNCDDDWLSGEEFVRQLKGVAEELVDVITCCITRLDIMGRYKGEEDFATYLQRIADDASDDYLIDVDYRVDDDFYVDLVRWVSHAYNASRISDIVQLLTTEGYGTCLADISVDDYGEEKALAYIIFLCIKRLEYIGYDESARQNLYHAVNEKNRKRGYFDD